MPYSHCLPTGLLPHLLKRFLFRHNNKGWYYFMESQIRSVWGSPMPKSPTETFFRQANTIQIPGNTFERRYFSKACSFSYPAISFCKLSWSWSFINLTFIHNFLWPRHCLPLPPNQVPLSPWYSFPTIWTFFVVSKTKLTLSYLRAFAPAIFGHLECSDVLALRCSLTFSVSMLTQLTWPHLNEAFPNDWTPLPFLSVMVNLAKVPIESKKH